MEIVLIGDNITYLLPDNISFLYTYNTHTHTHTHTLFFLYLIKVLLDPRAKKWCFLP